MESMCLLYFVLTEILIVGFIFVKSVKHSILIPIEIFNLFSILLVIFVQ